MTLTAALVQMRSGSDMARNLTAAAELIRAAHAAGAKFVTTPEMTNVMEPDRARLAALVRPEADDPAVAGFAELARELGLWLNIGSLALRGSADRLVNCSLLFAPDGIIAARYDKIHLFDVDLPGGERLRESETYAAGSTACLAELPWGGLGMTVCYDLRFPGLFRALAESGAMLFTVPSAFTVPTGEAHWHVLLRARAIETGSFVLAAAQGGLHDSGRRTYGHSLAVSPWGAIVAEGTTEPGVIVAEIDLREAAEARRRIPALRHGRAFTLNDASA
jgi:predicted amidohydrolase